MAKPSVILTASILSLAMAAAAAAQSGGLISTAPKTESEAPVRRNADDALAKLPGEASINLGAPSASLSSAPTSKSTAPSLAVSARPKAEPKAAEPPAPLGKIRGIGPFGLIIPKNGERIPVETAPKGPPSTVGMAKAAPLCVVDGALVACGSTRPAADE